MKSTKTMGSLSRILILVASLLLALSFFAPLWKIDIWAPQYPEGLFLQIWSDKITGDVRNLNILNHYIGMKPIDENSIPELRFLPRVFAFFLISGIAVAAAGRRKLLYAWGALLAIFAVASLVDFYLWGYDFGHNLSEDAAIKLDESYQPPLIGRKELLNIIAWSLPHWAGYGVAVSLFLTGIAGWMERRRGRLDWVESQKIAQSASRAVHSATTLGMAVILLSASACLNGKAEPIEYGHDRCHDCKMVITDRRFGAEVVSDKGKVFKFDSLECMNSFLRSDGRKAAKIFVPDVTRAGELIEAQQAVYVIEEGMRGPMGKAVFASASVDALNRMPELAAKKVLQWNEVLQNLHVNASH